MSYFEFVMRTKLCSGEKALEHIPYELSRLKAEKPLIMTDKTLEKLGLLTILTQALGDAFALAAVKGILGVLPAVLKNPQDRKARLALANASFMAGVSFSNSMVGAVHAIGHALGAVCHIPHGEAMAVLLPRVMRFNQAPEYAGLEPFFNDPEPVVAIEVLLEALHQKTGLPVRLSQTGKVNEADFETIAQKALNDGAILFNVKPMGKDDIIQILQNSF